MWSPSQTKISNGNATFKEIGLFKYFYGMDHRKLATDFNFCNLKCYIRLCEKKLDPSKYSEEEIYAWND